MSDQHADTAALPGGKVRGGLVADHAAPGSANPLVGGGDKADSQGPSSLDAGTRLSCPIPGCDHRRLNGSEGDDA